MYGCKSKFIMKVDQVLKQEEFSKGGRRFLKLKKIGGDEGTILKHKGKSYGKEPSNQQEANTLHNEPI